jgi:hypothetical protein
MYDERVFERWREEMERDYLCECGIFAPVADAEDVPGEFADDFMDDDV